MKILKCILLSLVFFLSSCGGGGSGSSSEEPIPTPPDVREDEKVGLAILGLLNPRFPVATATELLSVQSRPRFTFLNATFGKNPANFIALVDSLQSQGKSPHVGIYAICGPCRVPRRDGSLVQFRDDLDIPSLNRALANDPRTQEDYRNFLIDLRQNFLALFPELEYDIFPELEDNFDVPARTVAVRIAQEVFAGSARIITNPLGFERTPGLPVEIHSDFPGNLPLLKNGDAWSFDGQNMLFPGESGPGLSFEATKQLIRDANAKGVVIYLWRHEWQGLTKGSNFSPPVNERNYVFTNKERIKELLLE
jgi:hypothetical protein